LTNDLYDIINLDNTETTICLADVTHPVFAAHFPDYPVLPAFLQVDIASEIFNLNIVGISYSKFIEPLFPLDKLIVQIDKQDEKIKIKYKKQNKVISEMMLEAK
jgi:3-hydroxymyristoyl/3-hydroxydecanoyl-(acyl carrier protein) dehydratase